MEQGQEAVDAGYGATVEEFAGLKVPVNAGMAIVVPAERIVKMLEKDDYVKDRERRADEARDARPTGTPDSAEDAPERSEFERFEDLTRKLVNTPKPTSENS
jgi:hypothetical protein